MKILVVFSLCLSASLAQNAPSYFLLPPGVETSIAAPTEVTTAAETIPTAEPTIGPVCMAPYDGEATTFLLNVADVMWDTLATDRYSRGAIAYFGSPRFLTNLALLQKSPEYIKLQDYACRDMFIDSDYIFRWLGQRAASPPPPRNYTGLPRGGFEALVDMSRFPPSLMQTFVGATPERIMLDLNKAYQSSAFDRIADRLMDTRAYKRIEEQLDVFNVDLSQIGEFYEEILYQFSRLNKQQNPRKQQKQQKPKV